MFIGFIYHRGFMWEFYEILCFLSHYCYTFEVLRVHVRVLWDHSLFRSLLIYLWMWEMNNLLLGSPVFSTIPSLVIWLFIFVPVNIDHHLFYFLFVFLCFPIICFQVVVPHFYSFLTSLHVFDSIPFSHHSYISFIV